ncbi:MAG: carbohydrate ABC transporter permease [Acetatifactor sp.]|nr:carbohydrate ABC transporter permease [Acetatifactor sp.]
MKNKIKKAALYGTAIILAILFLIPIGWMLIVALKPEGNSATSIVEWFNFSNLTLDNFNKVLKESQIIRWTYNSFVIATITTAISVLLCSLGAFAFSKLEFKSKKVLFVLITLGLMIPTEAIIIPLYDISLKLHLIDNMWGIILPGVTNPLGIILMRQFMDGVPDEYVEAAKLDGCRNFRIWWNICVPLTKSSMVSIGLFYFLLSWNNFMWPFICITSADKMVLATGIPTFLSNNMLVLNTIMAASAVAAIPAMTVFVLLQKQIIQGVSMTGVKG